mgnify:FL=1
MDELSERFLEKVRATFGDAGGDLAGRALAWSVEKHGASQRASGEPAWVHDLRVAASLLDMGMDLDSVVAGLVHDITEHRTSGYFSQEAGSESPSPAATAAPAAAAQSAKPEKDAHRKALAALPDPAISAAFGEETARIVAGVARLSTVRAKNKTVQAAETMRKMLFAMTGDIRVIIVKLADKLDSMRTLKYWPEDRQKTIAAETLDHG